MILTLKTSKKKFFKEVKAYFDSYNIPSDGTGRTDAGPRVGLNSKCTVSGMDNKMLVEATEGYKILLYKDVWRENVRFETFLSNGKNIWGDARFINEHQIDILDFNKHGMWK